MTTFVIVYFVKIKSYACLPSPTQSTTETEINSFRAGQKTLLYDMVTCILAWTKGCGYWLGLCPRQGQEVQRGSPCPVMEALSWSSGSLRAGRVSWGLETAPGLPPWETTRGHKGLLQWLKCIYFNDNEATNLHLPQWCLPGFLWDAELTTDWLRLSQVDGVSTLEVAAMQVFWITASPCVGGGKRCVPTLFTPRGCGPWGWRVHKAHCGIVHIFLLHQEGITARSGAEPSSGRGAGGRARTWGAGASVTVSKRIQQWKVETLPVPATTTTTITHIPVPWNSGRWVIFWGDCSYLNTWALNHTRLWNLEGKLEDLCIKM